MTHAFRRTDHCTTRTHHMDYRSYLQQIRKAVRSCMGQNHTPMLEDGESTCGNLLGVWFARRNAKGRSLLTRRGAGLQLNVPAARLHLGLGGAVVSSIAPGTCARHVARSHYGCACVSSKSQLLRARRGPSAQKPFLPGARGFGQVGELKQHPRQRGVGGGERREWRESGTATVPLSSWQRRDAIAL